MTTEVYHEASLKEIRSSSQCAMDPCSIFQILLAKALLAFEQHL